MVTITTDAGQFTGDTFAEAQKAVRKAEKLAAKQADIEKANYKDAKCQAFQHAYWLLQRHNRPQLHFYAPGEQYAPVTAERTDSSVFSLLLRFNGGATQDFLSTMQFLGSIESPSGNAVGIFLRDGDGPIGCYAVGVCENQNDLLYCEGVKPEDFQQS